MNDDPIIHVEIQARMLEDLRAFADEVQPDLGCRPIARRTDDRFVIDAYLPASQLEIARAARAAGGVTLRVIENATEVGRERQKEVGQGDRFAARGTVPRGLGRKE